MQHPEAGIVDIVTGAGAMRCAGLCVAPADGWVLIFLIVLFFLIFLICGVMLVLSPPSEPIPCVGKGQG